MSLLREYVIVTISVLTLLVASAAVYGILTINTQIQAKPDQSKMSDYVAQLDLLSSQIDSMKSQLTLISNLNNSIEDIHQKLTDIDSLKSNITNIQQQMVNLENKNSQVQQTAFVTSTLTSVLDKSSYHPGDTINISAIGATPQNIVQIELLDNSGFVIIHTDTYADSSGKMSYGLQLSSALPQGNYVLKLTSDQQTTSQSIIVTSSTSNTNTTNSSSILTVQTDKSVYLTGQLVQVSGKAQPNTAVTSVMTSSSGKTYNSITTSNADGSYSMFYAPLQPYETGKWTISVSNLAQTTTVYVTIQQS